MSETNDDSSGIVKGESNERKFALLQMKIDDFFVAKGDPPSVEMVKILAREVKLPEQTIEELSAIYASLRAFGSPYKATVVPDVDLVISGIYFEEITVEEGIGISNEIPKVFTSECARIGAPRMPFSVEFKLKDIPEDGILGGITVMVDGAYPDRGWTLEQAETIARRLCTVVQGTFLNREIFYEIKGYKLSRVHFIAPESPENAEEEY